MGLNHIYKVIWSKTKNAWVVVSEIAKRDGKSSVKSVVTSLAGRSVAAVMVAMVMCGGVASANTVYGPGAIVNGSNSTAIGDNANIDNLSKDSVAIGPNASIINGTDSVTIGSSSSSKKFGIAIGGTAKSSDTGAIAIGRHTNSEKEDSITIGNYADNNGGSIVIGRGSTINNYDPSRTSRSGILIGDGANSIDVGSIGIGNGVSIGSTSASSHSSYSIAIGDAARVEGNQSVVIGYRANSALQADYAISIGSGARTDGSHSIALGSAIVNHDNSIAIGTETMTSGDRSIAIGLLAKIKENYITPSSNSIAIGQEVSVDGGTSIAMGYGVRVDANRTVAIGSNNRHSNVLPYDWMPIVASDSVVLGYNHQLDNSSSSKITTLGYHNTVDASRTIVIGNEIVVANDLEGAVVLGDSSEASPYVRANDVTISGMTIQSNSFAGNSGSKGSILSIGSSSNNRQIKNVAAGVISATSTDAINGSQLYEAVRAVTAGASPDVYMHVNDGTSTQGAGGGNNLGKANEKSGALGNYSIAVGKNAQSKGINSISIGYQSGTTNDQSIAIGGNAHVNSSHSIAIGDNANASGTYSIAMGASSVNGDKNLALNNSYVYSGNDSVAINGSLVAGNNNIAIGGAYIGAGRTYTRDASGNPTSTIMNMQTAAPTLGISSMQGEQYLEPVKNSIAIGNNAYVTRSNTIVMGDKTFDNIKSSKTATDFIAPTKSQFSSIFSGSINLYHEGTLGNSVYLGHDSYAFTPDALTDGESSSSGENSIHTKKYDATGNIVVSNNTTGGAFGKVSKATINGDEITGFAGAQSVGAVTIGAGDYERRIQNVAAGEVSATSTDGINGSQLYAVANTLSKNMSSYMHINDGTSTQTVGNATTNYGYSGSKAGATGNLAIAGGMNAKASGQQSLSLGSYTKSEGDYSVVIGSSHDTSWSTYGRGQTFALGNYSVVLGRGAQTNKDNSIAIGHRTEVKGEDSIGIGKYVFTGGYSPVSTESSSGITAVGTKLGVDGINTNVFGQGKIDNIGGGSPIRANDSTILGNRNQLASLDSNGQQILPSSINDYATGSHILGNDNQAWGNNAIAIGNKIFVYQNSVALGYAARAFGNKSIALGYGATANGENSISIGTGNDVEGAKSSAIGDPSYIDTTATGTHVHGNDNGTATNPIKASESTFMGNTNLAGTAGTTGIHVVGNNNSVDSSNVMVMGNNVTVGTGLDGAVVLGHASSADQYAAATDSTINGVTFEAAGYAGNTGLNNGSIVSVGATGAERQIKNVAAGAVTATSTDAINGSQLYKTAETILKMPINMAGDSGDTVGLKLGKTVNIKGSVASGADVTDGNIAVVGDKATSTLSLKMAKNLTGLTSGTFTDATGNQIVINGAGVTVTPTGTGTTPISITTSGINAGNQEIKGVKKGTTDDAAVNKKQMDDALAGISSTLTINDGTTDGSVNIKTGKLKVVGESGANALVTTTVSGDTITVGTSTKLQNAVTAAEKSADKDLSNLSATGSDKVKTLAQDAVKVAGTGLATVSDATAAGVKTYTVNVDEGKLVIDDTTGKIGAAGASQGTVQGKDGVATTQNVASVVNSAIDKTKQALDDAKHNFAGDDATVISRKHGEQLNIKGGASTTATDLTSGNIAVVGDTTSGTLNIKMAKALTGLTSATYTDAAGNTQTVTGGSSTISDAAGNSTVVSKGGVTTTDGTNTTTVAPTGVTATDGTNTVKLTGSGIDAGNTQIKNVGKATTDDAAVNKKQMDDALKGATDNTVSLGSESGSTTAKKLSTTGGIKFNIKGETGANALITTSATGDDVTIAPTAKLTAAVTAAENSANKDLSNLSTAGDTYIKNLAKSAASWNVETNGAGTTAVAGGETVNFINGDNIAITNTGRSITIGTAKNVSFDKVTVGGIVLDKTDGINAGGKEIKGVATGTAADSAVNKGQMDAAITAAASGSLSTEKVVAKTLTGDNNLATVTGQTGTAKGETYEVSVSENAVKAVAATAAQDAVKVAGTGLATVSDATAAGVKTYTVNVDEGKLVIDDTTGKIGANGATQGTTQGKNGVATTQDVASVVNSAIDKTKQALDDAKHNFAGDDATVISRKHGEQLNIKGGASTTATDLTSGNIAVVGDTTSGTLNIKMAKALTGLTSATYTDAAGNTQTVTGGSSTISDAAGNSTVVSKGGMTTTDGTNTTTVAPAGVTATDGTNTVKLNGSGIDAGNTQIKNVGKATTDDAAVNKKQMDDALKGATDNTVSLGSESGSTTAKKLSTTGGIKFNIKGETGANALITTSATGDDVTIAPTAKLTAAVTAAEKSADKDLSNISPAGETVIKNLAATSAQDAVKVTGTGLATVSDSTTGGVKTYNVDVKTGNLVVTAAGQVGATGTTGAGGSAGADGVATTQNVASAINDAITKSKTDTAQAIADAEHKFDGDTGTTSVRKHGEVLSVKGGVTATTDLTTGNIGVVSDGAGTLNIRLAKVLSGLTSATYTDAAGNTQTVTGGSSTITDGAGNTTTITKGGMTTTDGTNTTTVAPAGVTATDGTNTVKLNGSGIDAGNTQIKNVGKATTDDAAVNKKQMDDAVKAATDSISTLGDNKVSLGSDSGTTTAKKLSTTGGIKFNIKGDTGANALITTSATGDDVTIAPTAKLSAAVTAAENSANKDLSNLSAAGDTYIKNLAKTAASWNVETNGAGTTAVAGGDTVNFINGDNIAITNTGRSITIGTAKNVSFDKVTVGGVVIDKNNGIDAGGKEITNVGPATSGNSAVNKTQMDTAIANAQTAATSTEKVVAKTLTGDTNLVTVTGQTGTAKGETYEVAVSENAVKAVAQTAAQDAVKVTGTGLATVSDSTTGGVKTYNVDVKTGNLVVTATGQVGAAGTTGAGGAAGANGVATTQNVASAINDAITKSNANTAQAIADAEHKFDGDTGTTSVRKHGEVLSIKGGVTATTDLTTGNIGVVSDGAGTLNIRLAKTLTGLTSAAFTDGTHTVTIAGSGIDAGNTEIKHVGKATTDDAAVNKKQMDDAVKAATDSVTTLGDNKVSLGSDSGTTTAKKLSTTGGIKFNIKGDTGANALITTSATGDDVTIAPTAKLSAAVTAAENSANKDLSNLSTAGNTYIQNLAKSAASWNVETNGAGTTAVAGGDTVNFINGDNIAITNTGRSITIGTAKNVSFDKVTVGGVVIDKNNGIDAGGKEITNVGPATSGNSAVNKTQMDTAITNAVNKATSDAKHDFGGDDTTVVTRKHGEKLNIKGGASTTAADLTSGNIAVLGDSTTGTLNIRMAKALTGLSSATFTTPSGTTVINGGGMTITPSTTGAAPISITTGGINAGNTEIKNVAAGTTPNSAVNKQQMDSAISNATANVGFSTAGNTGTGSVSNGQTLSITGTNGIETNASGQSITVGLDAATRAQINNATTTANNAAKKDLSNIDNAGKQVIKDTAAWNVKVNSGAPEIVKGGDTVTFNDGDNIKVTNTGKDITIATKKDVSFDKVTVGNVVIDKNTNRISGLANAANNDEAVNLGQMNAAISTATAGTGTIKYKANGGTQNSVALSTGFDFKGDSNIQITADPANSGVINYKLNPALTGITSISGGTGAPTITLNAGSGSTPGNVSINSNLDMGGKQINNIGAATHAGDAVNKAQMDQALQNIAGASSNAAKSYAYKAGAGAAALAALKPIQYDPLEPTQIMAGIGNYKSQTAVALGVAHYTNENTMFNLGVSLDSHDGIVNAGVTHKFGYSPEKKAIPDKYKGGPISSIYVMQDEVTALQAIVQKQAAENEALRQQNEDMQRKVDMILSKIH